MSQLIIPSLGAWKLISKNNSLESASNSVAMALDFSPYKCFMLECYVECLSGVAAGYSLLIQPAASAGTPLSDSHSEIIVSASRSGVAYADVAVGNGAVSRSSFVADNWQGAYLRAEFYRPFSNNLDMYYTSSVCHTPVGDNSALISSSWGQGWMDVNGATMTGFTLVVQTATTITASSFWNAYYRNDFSQVP